MGLVQVMSAVNLALKARLLPDGVIRAELRGDHPHHWGGTVREDKRLEYRPTRVRVGRVDRERNRKERKTDSETPISPKWRQNAGKEKMRRERVQEFKHLHTETFEIEMAFQ